MLRVAQPFVAVFLADLAFFRTLLDIGGFGISL